MRFVHESVIAAPVERVFAWHAELPAVFSRLIPPWESMRVLEAATSLEIGARFVFDVGVGPFTFRWIGVHTAYEKDRLFIDTEVKGPFRQWIHRHEFLPEGDHCRYRDDLTIGFWGDPVVGWFAAPFVRRKLARFFAFRHAVVAAAFTG